MSQALDRRPPQCYPMVGSVPLVIRDKPVMKPWHVQVPAHGWFTYDLWDADDQMLYVGMTSGLRTRLRQHSVRFPEAVMAFVRACVTERDALEVEAILIAVFDPPANLSRGRVDLLSPSQREWVHQLRIRYGRDEA